ncbi:hypothetical protein VNO77_43755 [Canavalia gladiata]|uniref:Uncharacterized protein n=1 Tax=Canavalia gladiata TaxID=3824 RepID=A0AAN9JVD7_CANGL
MLLRFLHLFLFVNLLRISTRVRELHLTWRNDPCMHFLCFMYFTLKFSAPFFCLVALLTTVKFTFINKMIKISETNLCQMKINWGSPLGLRYGMSISPEFTFADTFWINCASELKTVLAGMRFTLRWHGHDTTIIAQLDYKYTWRICWVRIIIHQAR